ncbi:hypothetical protein PENSPDRAFT_482236 [Peniophora sp. CONT]|nr:hypothetical protein PENSPDRAFT_482236 [Peniophora sp. CONT]
MVHVQLLVSAVAQGDEYTIPSNWRKPAFSLPPSQRTSIAQIAINTLTNTIDINNGTNSALNTWQSANVLADIAQLDYVSNTKENHILVQQSVAAFRNGHPAFFDTQIPRNVTSDPLMWGLAAFYGARAYNDTGLLATSISVWSLVQQYVVDDQDTASGTQPTDKNGTFRTNCSSNINAGAVFWQATSPDDYTTNAETVGAYVALSAHLWEATGNKTYLDSAEQSAQFMYTHMYTDDLQIIQDTFDLATCTVTGQLEWTYNQGFFMEGLSFLSNAPLATNSTWTSLLRTLEATNFDPSQNLVVFNYRNVFIRALLEIWSRTSSSDPMASFIEAFVAVQFNALQDLASDDNTNYSPVWTGPPLPVMAPWGQLAAVPVLNAAVHMALHLSNTNNSAKGVPTPTPIAAPSGAPSSGSNASNASESLSSSAIAGIITGLLAGAILASALVVSVRRYKRHIASDEKEWQLAVHVQPFESSALYQQPAETEGASERVQMGSEREHIRGHDAGEDVERPLSTLPDRVQPPIPSPSAARAPNEGFIDELAEQVLERIRRREEPPAYSQR